MMTSERRLTAVATLIAALVVVLGCDPPVSDDARLTITGRVLEPDGSPAVDQEVYLYKSDLPLFESDWWLGATIAAIPPFRTVRTENDGTFEIDLDGADANTAGQGFAAYFAVATYRGDDRQLGVASKQFRFSNNRLSRDITTMQFWDDGDATVGAESVTFSWGPPPTGDGRVHVALPVGVWFDATDAGSYELPLSALPPTVDTHPYELVAVTDDLRYRTSVRTFEASNPLGAGLDYRDPDTNVSALDCEGGNVFDLADGVYGGDNGQGSHLFADDTGGEHCVVIDLQGTRDLEQISVHNTTVLDLRNASVEISLRTEGGDWTVVHTQEGRMTDYDTYYALVPSLGGASADEIKIEVVSQTDARFFSMGEVVVHVQQ